MKIARRRLPCLAFLVAAAAAVSCGGGNTITVTVTPSATAAVNDGQSPTQVVALVMVDGVAADDGTNVTFTVSSGTSASFAQYAPATATTQTLTVQTAAGDATAQIYDVADEVVAVSITAAITPSDGSPSFNVTGNTSITFGGKCPSAFVSAQPTSLQSGVPASITLGCSSDYMGGIFQFDEETEQLFTGNTQGCIASVNDAAQQAVGGAAVQFLTEAGTFETDVVATGQHPTEITSSLGIASVNYHVSAPYPEDVDWTNLDGYFAIPGGGLGNKREWTGTDAMGNPHTYNPRDGWVTMIAAVPGIPSGDPTASCNTTSCPEPYVDENDNGQWDLGEPYIDVNCNGSFDAQQTANAQGLVDIWTYKTIVWTDGVWLASSCATGETGCTGTGFVGDDPPSCSINISANTSCTLVFRWVDKNLNLLSTFLSSSDNQIAYSASNSSLTVTPDVYPLDQALVAQSLTLGTDYSVLVADTASPSPYGNAPYTVSAAGTFVFGDTSITQPSEIVEEQTFTEGQSGSCQVPSD